MYQSTKLKHMNDILTKYPKKIDNSLRIFGISQSDFLSRNMKKLYLFHKVFIPAAKEQAKIDKRNKYIGWFLTKVLLPVKKLNIRPELQKEKAKRQDYRSFKRMASKRSL